MGSPTSKAISTLPTALAVTIQSSSHGSRGTHVLERIGDRNEWAGDALVLREEPFGWCISLKDDDDALFFKDKDDSDNSPAGTYGMCPTCPGDDIAVVTLPESTEAAHKGAAAQRVLGPP